MTAFRFFFLVLICIVWGFHFTVIKVTVSEVPTFFYVAVRMGLVALILLPFLRWHKEKMPWILTAGAFFGGLNYVFMFSGVNLTTASLGAVMLETYMPLATIFSVIFLKEKIGLPRIMGLVLAFSGVVLIVSAGEEATGAENLYLGAILVLCGAASEATGAILVKRIEGVPPFQLLVWFGIVGALITTVLSLLFETDQMSAFEPGTRGIFLAALAYSVLLASIFGHGGYYWLLQRIDVSQVAGGTVLTTVFAVMFGVILLGDPLTWRFVVGGIVTLIGVAIIVLRNGQKAAAQATTPLQQSPSEAEASHAP